MLTERLDDLNLFLGTKTIDRRLNHAAHRHFVHCDEALIVHEREKTHDELTIHAIGDAAMSRYTIAEILDVERAL